MPNSGTSTGTPRSAGGPTAPRPAYYWPTWTGPVVSGGTYTNRPSSAAGAPNGGWTKGTPLNTGGMRTNTPPIPPRPTSFSNMGGSRPAGSPSVDRGVRGCGCLTVPLIIAAIILIIMLLGSSRGCGAIFPGQSSHTHSASSQSSGQITVSTIKRTKLESGIVHETGYYTDELGWIRSSSKLTKGMRNFYKRTGVQPYLYLTDTVKGTHDPTNAQLDSYANDLYDELFDDEGHLLLLFFEYDSKYTTWYVAGNAASTVIDGEAAEILLDYIDRYYANRNLSDEEMFSKAFDEASDRMMKITVSPWVYVGVTFLVLVILVVALIWWAIAKKKKKEEEERMQQILNMPLLETYADADLKQREGKYDVGSAAPPSAPPQNPGQSTDVTQ